MSEEVINFVRQMVKTIMEGPPEGLIIGYSEGSTLNCLITGTSTAVAAELLTTLMNKGLENEELGMLMAFNAFKEMMKHKQAQETADTATSNFIKQMMEKNNDPLN